MQNKRRICQSPDTDVARGDFTRDGPNETDAAVDAHLSHIALRRWVFPHRRMHRGSHDDGDTRASATAVTRSSARPAAKRANRSAVAGAMTIRSEWAVNETWDSP